MPFMCSCTSTHCFCHPSFFPFVNPRRMRSPNSETLGSPKTTFSVYLQQVFKGKTPFLSSNQRCRAGEKKSRKRQQSYWNLLVSNEKYLHKQCMWEIRQYLYERCRWSNGDVMVKWRRVEPIWPPHFQRHVFCQILLPTTYKAVIRTWHLWLIDGVKGLTSHLIQNGSFCRKWVILETFSQYWNNKWIFIKRCSN